MSTKAKTKPAKATTKKAASKAQGTLFDAAASRAKTGKKTKAPRGTTLVIPADAGDDVHAAVESFGTETTRKKQAADQADSAKNTLEPVATQLLAERWVESNCRPPGPIAVQNREGKRLVYVVQDCTRGHVLDDEEVAELKSIVGRAKTKAIDKLLERVQVFSFSRDVLQEPGVMEKLSAAIANSGLTKAQQAALVECKIETRINAKIGDDLPDLVGRDVDKLVQVLDVLGGAAIKRYPKA